MTRVGVRSDALLAVARRLVGVADDLRGEGGVLAQGVARCRSPAFVRGSATLGAWVRVEVEAARVLGPAGLAGEALALEALALRLRLAARAYAGVEEAAAAVLAGVRVGADEAHRVGWFDESGRGAVVHPVPATWHGAALAGPGDLVALGRGLDGGRVRVVEVGDPQGGSAWVVAVPGTQTWSPEAGANPFDLTTDLAAVGGGATLAGAGVTAALDAAQAASARRRGTTTEHVGGEPVLLVGHSQGGIHAAALAADPGFTARHRVTHVLTTGAPVGLVPVPTAVRVLSVEHADDPVPALDLGPDPARSTWLTLRVGQGPPVDVSRHRLEAYERTVRAATGAPRGVVPGLGAWEASAGSFLGQPVRGVTEVVVERGIARGARTGPAP
ncbi:hypothetical protein [Phycicoccus sp.]|uniref:hypothetical protein n=1 Tax=Phycicoccus sp. TaxID=1902410 RepID=UPI002BA6D406|nr:hypothetical protein [Phycicoccus sp.]HMM95531.1 hypothetical protein [Phycicoccus sp.]